MQTTEHAAVERIDGPNRVMAELLDVQAVAAMLHCSPRHVYRLSDAGKMPGPIKLGTLARWNRAELVGWVTAGCQPLRVAKGAR